MLIQLCCLLLLLCVAANVAAVSAHDIGQDIPHLRLLQGNDPKACSTDGEYFTCLSRNSLGVGGNTTKIEHTIRCPLHDAIGYDFQARPELCQCWATLTNQQSGEVRQCSCGVCPYGRPLATALDCRNVIDNPFIAGPCSSLDCDGRCNGTGVGAVNQPTPSPNNGDDDLLETESDSSATKNRSLIWIIMGSLLSFWWLI